MKREYPDFPFDKCSGSQAEIATCVAEWLTKHPNGLGGGQGGRGASRFEWRPDVHYRACHIKDVCPCCMAKKDMAKKDKKAENEKSCQFCMETIRLVSLSTHWKGAMSVIWRKKEKWWKRWSPEERKAKFAERKKNYGNIRSSSWNFFVAGEVGKDRMLLRAHREKRLYEAGSEPQGKDREWPNMMDITSYRTEKDFLQIQQENNNRWKDDDHNDDHKDDDHKDDDHKDENNWGSTAKVEDKKDGGSQANHDWSWAKVLDEKDDVGWKKSNQSWTTEERSKQEWSKPSWAKNDWSHDSVWENLARNEWPPTEPKDPWRGHKSHPIHSQGPWALYQ